MERRDREKGLSRTRRANPSSASAQRLAPDTSTLPTTPQHTPSRGPDGKGSGGETTKSNGENRGGFSTRSGAGGETQGGEGGDWLAARSYAGSYGSANVARGKRGERRGRGEGSPLDRALSSSPQRGDSRGSPRGAPLAGGGAHARGALDFVSPPDFS